jgi:hypothetical protein
VTEAPHLEEQDQRITLTSCKRPVSRPAFSFQGLRPTPEIAAEAAAFIK